MMASLKNRAVLYYKRQSFVIWQDANDNWLFTYGALNSVSTQTKDLQTALNVVYETINENMPNRKPYRQRVTKS